MAERFDLVVLGVGQSGSVIQEAVDAGWRVAAVERRRPGGTCLNVGCIPTKILHWEARVARLVHRAREFGVRADDGVDFEAAMARMRRMVAHGADHLERAYREGDNPAYVHGEGRLVGDREVEVDGRRLRGEHLIVATGQRPTVPPVEGLAEVPYLTNETALELDALPRELLVLGGGYIGVEFAQIFARFGSQVTVVQDAPRLLPETEPEASEVVERVFEEEGLDVRLGSAAVAASAQGGRVALELEGGGRVEGDALLVAAGRTPNTDIGLREHGVRLSRDGFVEVDDHFRTSARNVWAFGDVVGRKPFTHAARAQAEVVAANLLRGEARSFDFPSLPSAAYADPEVATVGMLEEHARAEGWDVAAWAFPFRCARMKAMGEAHGLVKLVVERSSGRLLGCTIVAPDADVLLHLPSAVVRRRGHLTELLQATAIHPSLTEGLEAAVQGAVAELLGPERARRVEAGCQVIPGAPGGREGGAPLAPSTPGS